jgi:hypothetical protein
MKVVIYSDQENAVHNDLTVSSSLVPSVGIFWRVSDYLVVDRSALSDAEPYGDCLTHAMGHYDRWQQWQGLGGAKLTLRGLPKSILSTEYDDWPRGRVVYEIASEIFVVYADRRLQKPGIIAALKAEFGIATATVRIRSDLHYRTTSALRD